MRSKGHTTMRPPYAGRWFWIVAAGLAVLAGCATTPEAQSDKPAASGAKPAQPPAAAQPAAPPPVAAQPAAPAQPAQVGKEPASAKPLTEEERNRVREQIYQKLREQEARTGEQPKPQPVPPPAADARIAGSPDGLTRSDLDKPVEPGAKPAHPTTPLAPQPAAAKPGEPATGEKKEDTGCAKGTPGELPFPDEGAPQPKLVIKEGVVMLNEVWKGEKPTFTFELTNTGEGPLAIKLKGG